MPLAKHLRSLARRLTLDVMSLCAILTPLQAMCRVLTLLSRRRLKRANFSIDANLHTSTEREREGGRARGKEEAKKIGMGVQSCSNVPLTGLWGRYMEDI